MSDQLSSVGVEFDLDAMKHLFLQNLRYSAAHTFPFTTSSAARKHPLPWANSDIFPTSRLSTATRDDEKKSDSKDDMTVTTTTTTITNDDIPTLWATARPWGLGQTRAPTSLLQKALGESLRRPGLFMRVDEDTNTPTREPLVNTGEAVHSSVRVRLACGGLGMDDEAVWACPPLLQQTKEDEDEDEDKVKGQPLWRLERDGDGDGITGDDAASRREVGESAQGESLLYPVQPADGNYRWVYTGPVDVRKETQDSTVPQAVSLPEEPLRGPSERLLLAVTAGYQDVWRYAEEKGAGGGEPSA